MNFFRRFLFLRPVTATRGSQQLAKEDNCGCLSPLVAPSFPLFRALSIGHRGELPGSAGAIAHSQATQRQRPEYAHPFGICICSVPQLLVHSIVVFMVKLITFFGKTAKLRRGEPNAKFVSVFASDTTSNNANVGGSCFLQLH